MAVQPKYEVVNFCYWLQNLDWRRLSTSQSNLVSLVSTAGSTQVTVTDQQWKDFNMISNWRYKYYEEWFAYAPFFSGYTASWLAALPSTPPLSYTLAVNDFIAVLVNIGAWAKLDRLYVFAAPTSGIALVSLVNPGSAVATLTNAPAFAPYYGYTGNGVNAEINSNFTPSIDGVNFALNSASFGAYGRIQAAAASAKGIMGMAGGGFYDILQVRYTGDLMRAIVNSGASVVTSSNTSTQGLFSAIRPDANNIGVVRNGITLGTAPVVATGLCTASLRILSRGSADYDTNQVSLAYFGSGAIDQILLYNAVQNFARVIGFNV